MNIEKESSKRVLLPYEADLIMSFSEMEKLLTPEMKKNNIFYQDAKKSINQIEQVQCSKAQLEDIKLNISRAYIDDLLRSTLNDTRSIDEDNLIELQINIVNAKITELKANALKNDAIEDNREHIELLERRKESLLLHANIMKA